jgi:tripartite-type tricarboxylate transporter receptor subunit TctC
VNAGRIRALAVMANERVATLPKVPTAAEAGMPELVVTTWYGLFAPTGTRPEIIARLHDEFSRLMKSPDVKSKLAQVELDATTSATPADFARFVRAEHDKWGRVIRDAGIPVQQ